MIVTTHAVIGAALVTKIPDLRISLPLALLSHFIFDLPGHDDAGNNWQTRGIRKVLVGSLVDLGIGYLVVALIFVGWLRLDPINVFLGAFTAQLPDFLEVPYFFFGWHTAPWKWVNDLQMLFHKRFPQIHLTIFHQVLIGLAFILLAAS